MSAFLRKFGKGFFVSFTLASSAIFLLSCQNQLFDPDRRWYVALLGLALPVLILIQILIVLTWLALRSRWFILPLAAILFGSPAIRTVVAFHFPVSYQLQKDSSTLRVMSWNVSWFDGQTNNKRKAGLYHQAMLDYIKDQQADVICFQEYIEPVGKEGGESHSSILRKMGYKYYHWVGDYVWRDGRLNAGTAIFSKYPILNRFRWKYDGLWYERAAESLIAADIDFHGSRIRVFTAHLQSLQFNKKDYQTLEQITDPRESSMNASLSIIRKIRVGYKYRVSQAALVREQLDNSPYPEILCGDFNDVPRSYAYTMVRGDRRDAFLEKGFGIGRTFNDISPTLRIDYIFTHPDFRVLQFKKTELAFTDHYPILADIDLNR